MATTATVTAPAQENIPTVLRNKPSAIVKPLHYSKSTATTDRPALAGVVNQTGPVTRSRRNGEGAKQTRAVARRTVTTRATTNRETEAARGGEATRTQQDRREEGGEQGGVGEGEPLGPPELELLLLPQEGHNILQEGAKTHQQTPNRATQLKDHL